MSIAGPLLATGRPLVCGHRGASADLPENTMAAFAAALDAGADALELDVHLSSDGVPVVIHDASLDRTTTASGPVAGRSAAALGDLDAGSWCDPRWSTEGVPRLHQVLGLCRGRALVLCELKADADAFPDAPGAVAVAVRATGMEQAASLLAFDHRHLVRARRSHPWLRRVALIEERPSNPAAVVRRLEAAALAPHHTAVDADLVAGVHAAGAAVVTWTVDVDEDASRLAALGVDVVITNRPAAIARLLRR